VDEPPTAPPSPSGKIPQNASSLPNASSPRPSVKQVSSGSSIHYSIQSIILICLLVTFCDIFGELIKFSF